MYGAVLRSFQKSVEPKKKKKKKKNKRQEMASEARGQLKALAEKRDLVDAELATSIDYLETCGAGMRAPLVDDEGFPRADIDVYEVRRHRQSVIRLRNDRRALSDQMERALHELHAQERVSIPPQGSVSSAPPPASFENSSAAPTPGNGRWCTYFLCEKKKKKKKKKGF
jgi:hypothetical protein